MAVTKVCSEVVGVLAGAAVPARGPADVRLAQIGHARG